MTGIPHHQRRLPGHSGFSAVPARVPPRKPAIRVAEPYPLLDPGEYVALCTDATFEWAKRFGAWKVRLVLQPENYAGRPYTGTLCKFFDLGKNAQTPYAGPRSTFRLLWVEATGGQPTRPDIDDLGVFVGRLYKITVETVSKNRNGEALGPELLYSIVRKIRALEPSTPLEPYNLGNLRNRGNLGNLLTDQPSNPVNLPLGKGSVFAESTKDEKDTFG